MIKNFEEYINEDYFSKLANRKDNGEVRKEDGDNYLKRWRAKCGKWFRWVDLDLPSGRLWCNLDYGSSYMYGPGYYMRSRVVNNMKDEIKNTEYEIPTYEEMTELFYNTNKTIDDAKKCIILTSKNETNKQKLIIPLGGYEECVYKQGTANDIQDTYNVLDGIASCRYIIDDYNHLCACKYNKNKDVCVPIDVASSRYIFNLRFVKRKE